MTGKIDEINKICGDHKRRNILINYYIKQTKMNGLNNNTRNLSDKQFLSGHDMDKGRVVRKYNIVNAKLEYYFIPLKNIEFYDSATVKQEQNAAIKFGMRLKVVAE